MPLVVVCVPSGGPPSVAPCADVGGVPHLPAVVQQPDPGTVMLDHSEQLFAYAFIHVIVFWTLGICIGSILSLVRKGQ